MKTTIIFCVFLIKFPKDDFILQVVFLSFFFFSFL